jgi:enoyl-CoA hydratase
MTNQNIKIHFSEGIGEIQLFRPNKLNALDHNLLKELHHTIHNFKQRGDLKCLYIKGDKKSFSSGGDLLYMSKMNEFDARESSLWTHEIFNCIENLKVFTMAIVEGIAFGGGLELALSCDMCIATENAQFSLPEMRFGIIPAGGGTIRYQEKSGFSNCLYTMSSNKILSAKEALQQGIIQDIIPDTEIDIFQEEYSKKIRSYSLDNIKNIKAHLKSVPSTNRRDSFKQESQLFGKMIIDEGKEKISAFFDKQKKEIK